MTGNHNNITQEIIKGLQEAGNFIEGTPTEGRVVMFCDKKRVCSDDNKNLLDSKYDKNTESTH